MTPISEIHSQSFLRAILQGPPGAGKTTLACGFPGAYIIDIDKNLAGPVRYRKGHNLSLPIGFDRVTETPDGKPVPPAFQYTRLVKLINEAEAEPPVQTIIIDSATGLIDILWAEVARQQPNVKDGRQLWGFFFTAGKQFITQLVNTKKHIVLIAHEKLEQDAMTQVLQFRVAWPGQLGDYIGAFFTNVWRCEVVQEGFGVSQKAKYTLRTSQDAQHHGLKNDLELPTITQFNWDEVNKKLTAE